MNRECEILGLVNTHFVNPHGLDDPAHHTSARDLAKLAAAALDVPAFAEAVATYKYTIHCENGDKRLLVNHNKLLHLYKGANGVKTGFTKKSGRCLVSAAEVDGVRLIAVTLNAPDDWNDHIRLFRFGFSQMECRLLCSAEDLLLNIPSFNQNGVSLLCTNSEDLIAILHKDAPAPSLSYEITPFISTPKPIGAMVGYVKCILDGQCIAESPIIIKEIHK
jgi:D-alanyl-D-alanine carboxypeptidase/D-alanyl-D-alanine carboxypeptidase (penicillin-binding protein 5/6)